MPGGGYHNLAPGQVTEEGELILCTLQALSVGSFDLNFLSQCYAKWTRSDPFAVGPDGRKSLFNTVPFLKKCA